MSDHQILFTGQMVRAILEGGKTETRRVLSPRTCTTGCPSCPRKLWDKLDFTKAWIDPGPSPAGNQGPYLKVPYSDRFFEPYPLWHRVYPRWQPGDHLWVKETWIPETEDGTPTGGAIYRATDKPEPDGDQPLRWKPSIFMPRWASRITLEVLAVGIERLQEITEAGAKAEGVKADTGFRGEINTAIPGSPYLSGTACLTAVSAYRDLWDSINSKRGYPWEGNPWVVVIKFRRVP